MSVNTLLAVRFSGSMTPEEAKVAETEGSSIVNQMFGMFGGGAAKEENDSDDPGDEDDDGTGVTTKFEDPMILQRDDHQKYTEECKQLTESIGSHEELDCLTALQLRYLVSLMKRDIIPVDGRPINQDDPNAPMIWLYSGDVQVVQKGFFGIEGNIRALNCGEFLGDKELFEEKPPETSAVVQGYNDAVIWLLERDIYADSVKEMLESRRKVIPKIVELLNVVPVIKDMPADGILKVAKSCSVESFAQNQAVCKAGRPGDKFCIIVSGEASTVKPVGPGKDPIDLGTHSRGEYFGEMAVIKNQKRSASVVAKTKLKVLSLEKVVFDRVLGSVADKMAERAAALYKQQDQPVVPTEEDTAASVFVKKRTRKSSLALRAYQKIAPASEASDEKSKDSSDAASTAGSDTSGSSDQRWVLAPDPVKMHAPPGWSAIPKKSSLKGESKRSNFAGTVQFDENTLLPSPPSSDDDIDILG